MDLSINLSQIMSLIYKKEINKVVKRTKIKNYSHLTFLSINLQSMLITKSLFRRAKLSKQNALKFKLLCKFSSQHPSQNPINHYQTLGISPQASFQQIKKTFRQLSKIYHPDYYKGTDNKFHDIQKAYKVLSDFKTRKHHDINLGIDKSTWESEEFKLDSDKFQNQAFEEILKGEQKTNIHSSKTIEQRLYERFQKDINTEMTSKQKFRALFWPLLGFGIFWATWNIFESIIINYQGSQTHEVKTYVNEKKLSSVPIKLN